MSWMSFFTGWAFAKMFSSGKPFITFYPKKTAEVIAENVKYVTEDEFFNKEWSSAC